MKIYVCFITYKDSFVAMISFVFCSRIINEFLIFFKFSAMFVFGIHFSRLHHRLYTVIKRLDLCVSF